MSSATRWLRASSRSLATAWSSYRAHTTQFIAPYWLDVDGLHAYVLGRELRHVADRREAGRRYASLVADSADADASIWQRGLTQQIYLGDEAFVARMQANLGAAALQSSDVPRAQRKPPGTLADCLRRHGGDRDAALVEGYRALGLTMSAMARELGLSATVRNRAFPLTAVCQDATDVVAAAQLGIPPSKCTCAGLSTAETDASLMQWSVAAVDNPC